MSGAIRTLKLRNVERNGSVQKGMEVSDGWRGASVRHETTKEERYNAKELCCPSSDVCCFSFFLSSYRPLLIVSSRQAPPLALSPLRLRFARSGKGAAAERSRLPFSS